MTNLVQRSRSFLHTRNGLGILLLLGFYFIFLSYIGTNPHKTLGWVDYYAWQNIAEKYASGHFKEALNAYWSPLIIWLMIPFIKLDLLAGKEVWLMNFIAGLVLIRLSFIFSKQFSLSGIVKLFFILGIYIFSVSFQLLYYDSADFLSAVCLIAYIAMVTSDTIRANKKQYLLCSIVAILCIFSKSFYTYFVLIHLLCLWGYHLYRGKGKQDYAAYNLIRTFACVLIAAGIWTLLLSWKYDCFMMNSSGKYNMAVMTPAGIKEDFDTRFGLFPPPDQYSCHHWVDPTYYKLERKIFSSPETLTYQYEIYKYNLSILKYLFSYFSYFKIAVLLFMVLAFCLKDVLAKERIVLYFFSALLIIAGYFLIFLEERYMGGVQILLFMGAYFSSLLFIQERNSFYQRKGVPQMIALLIFLAFAKIGWYSISFWIGKDTRHLDGLFVFEREVKELPFMKNIRFASTTSQSEVGAPMYYELFCDGGNQNFGSFRKNSSEQEQYLQLKKYKIDYYFHFGCTPHETDSCSKNKLPFYVEGKKALYRNAEYGVSIYSMKPYGQ